MEHFIDNNGVQIHALEFNSTRNGIPLVMVPGMGNAAEEIAENVGALLTRRTIILSLRGRGKSDSPKIGWRLEDQASDIATVVKHFGFPKIALFGHSTGGSIAARSLPMISAEVVAFIIGDFPPFYPAYSESWSARVKKIGLPMTDFALGGIVRDAKQTVVSEYLDSVRNLFAITGDPDTSLLKADDIARLEQLFPQIKIERLSGCGHEFLSDDPARSIEAIEKCVASAD
ncbi:MAG: alpha/beta fold hydrolase [Candidatus Kapaibacterium sp.]